MLDNGKIEYSVYLYVPTRNMSISFQINAMYTFSL